MQVTVNTMCASCHRGFFYVRVSKHARTRQYCPDCAQKVRRAKGNERVRKHRSEQMKNTTGAVATVHIAGCNGKTFCGRRHDARTAENVALEIRRGWLTGKLCKTCYRKFVNETGGDN